MHCCLTPPICDEMTSAALVSIVTPHNNLAISMRDSFVSSVSSLLVEWSFPKFQFRPCACTARISRICTEARKSRMDHRALSIYPVSLCVTVQWVLCAAGVLLKEARFFHSFHVARGAVGACVPLRGMWFLDVAKRTQVLWSAWRLFTGLLTMLHAWLIFDIACSAQLAYACPADTGQYYNIQRPATTAPFVCSFARTFFLRAAACRDCYIIFMTTFGWQQRPRRQRMHQTVERFLHESMHALRRLAGSLRRGKRTEALSAGSRIFFRRNHA